jgi:apolipoprotein N-acyltransferase
LKYLIGFAVGFTVAIAGIIWLDEQHIYIWGEVINILAARKD